MAEEEAREHSSRVKLLLGEAGDDLKKCIIREDLHRMLLSPKTC